MAETYQEELLQAMDIVVSKRMSEISYDQTKVCTITDTENALIGQYTVSDGTSSFLAYASETSYLIGTQVYVMIPNGDMNNQKMIIGRYVSDGESSVSYTPPLDDFIDVTENFITGSLSTSLLANKNWLLVNATDQDTISVNDAALAAELQSPSAYEKKIWSWSAAADETAIHDYNRLGMKAKFKTGLRTSSPKTGTFGLRLEMQVETTSSLVSEPIPSWYSFYFNNDDFFGNRFCLESYYSQEKLFDLSDILINIDTEAGATFTEIKAMNLYVYQDYDFSDNEGNKIPFLNDKLELLPDNLWIKDVYIAFGYSLSSFEDSTLMVGSYSGGTYSNLKTDNINKKENYLRWVVKNEDGSYTAIKDAEEFKELYPKGKVHWYRYWLSNEIVDAADELAGAFWVEILTPREAESYRDWTTIKKNYDSLLAEGRISEETHESKLKQAYAQYSFLKTGNYKSLAMENSFSYTFIPDTTKQEEQLKVIIETSSREKLKEEIKADKEFDDLITRFQNYATNDVMAPPLWNSMIKESVDVTYIEQQYREFLKDLDYLLTDPSEDKFLDLQAKYSAHHEPAEDEEDEYYDDNIFTINSDDITEEPAWPGQGADMTEYKDQQNKYASYVERSTNVEYFEKIKDFVLAAYTEREVIKSNVLTFQNEQKVVDYDSIDLIKGLQIEVDSVDNGGCGGVYFLYDSNNELLDSSEASKRRTLKASYSSLVTGNANLDTASSITWYIPLNNTMIQEPEENIEYTLTTSYDRAYKKWQDYEASANRTTDEVAAAKSQVRQILASFALSHPKFQYDSVTLEPVGDESKQMLTDTVDTYEKDMKSGYAIITRQGGEDYLNTITEEDIGEAQQIDVEQIFRIKNYYNPAANNNTITCKVVKNNLEYTATATLVFGTAGSNGTDVTFQLVLTQLTSKDKDGNDVYTPISAIPFDPTSEDTITVRVEPHLYDYNNKEINLKGRSVHYSWYSGSYLKDNYIGKANEAKQTAHDEYQKALRAYNAASEAERKEKRLDTDLAKAQQKYEEAVQKVNDARAEEGMVIEKESDEVRQNRNDMTSINLYIKDPYKIDVNYLCHSILQATIPGYQVLTDYVYTYDDDGKKILDANGDPVMVKRETEVDLTAYLPIPIRYIDTAKTNKIEAYSASVPSSIIYTMDGNNPSYYKNKFQLFDQYGFEIEDAIWYYDIQEQTDLSNRACEQYYPTVKENKNEDGETESYQIVPPSMFFKESTGLGYGYSLVAVKYVYPSENQHVAKILWVQPILIIQNRYNSSMLNSWDGSLQIDVENNTIMSAMVGAGIKNTDNSFSGVLMGNVSKASGTNTEVGLYGYDHGVTSFGFKVDGTAFLGASGKGRIYFDGNQGVIKGSNYSKDQNKGMMINLNYGLDGETEGSSFAMYGRNSKDEESYQGLEVDTTSGTIFKLFAKDQTGESQTKSLIEVGPDGYFLQTANYNGDSSEISEANRKGLKIDLNNGQLTGYNFKLKAGKDNRYVIINSDADDYPFSVNDMFKVNWNGSVSISNGDFKILESGSLEINKKFKVFLDGAIAIDKDLIKSDGTSDKFTISDDNKTTFDEGNSRPKFCVTSDGDLYASSGYFGGEIAGGALITGDIEIDGTFYVRGYGVKFNEDTLKYYDVVYDEESKTYFYPKDDDQIVGMIGYGTGINITDQLDDHGNHVLENTYGIKMSNSDGSRYLLATNAGIRMNANYSYFLLGPDYASFMFKDSSTQENYRYEYAEKTLSERETFSVRINGYNIIHDGNAIDYVPGILAIFA